MSKAEIIAELPRLSFEDQPEVQAKLDGLVGEAWKDRGKLSNADKQSLDAALAEDTPRRRRPGDEVRPASTASSVNDASAHSVVDHAFG